MIGCEPVDEAAYPHIAINGAETQVPSGTPVRPPVFKKATVVEAAPEPVSYIVRVRVTAYCPCDRCCGRMTGLTSTGANAWRPGIAADPAWLAYGTIVSIPGYIEKESIDDTGSRMRRRYWTNGTPRMDVRFQYHWQARDWGVQYLDVRIYRK